MGDASDVPRSAARPVPLLTAAMLRGSGGILDMLPVATLVCDAEGTILQYNKRAVEIWGRTPEPGQSHSDFTHGTRYFTAGGELESISLIESVLSTGTPVRNAERRVARAGGDGARLAGKPLRPPPASCDAR